MSISFGVHLGRTSMCLAAEKDGKFDVIANEGGDFITPTVYGKFIDLSGLQFVLQIELRGSHIICFAFIFPNWTVLDFLNFLLKITVEIFFTF